MQTLSTVGVCSLDIALNLTTDEVSTLLDGLLKDILHIITGTVAATGIALLQLKPTQQKVFIQTFDTVLQKIIP